MAVLFSRPLASGTLGIQPGQPNAASGAYSTLGTFRHRQQQQQSTFSSPPPWFGDWIRWRALAPALSYDKLVPPEKRLLDLAYSWVNGSDASLQLLRDHFQSLSPLFTNVSSHDVAQITTRRFRDMDELRYSVRSAIQYSADAVRNIYLMVTPVPDRPTANPLSFLSSSRTQSPDWFDATASQPKPFRLVSHADIFGLQEHLPTFNSLAIEANMRNIPGLSPNFIYSNDDYFISQHLNTADFWTPLYGYVLHMEVSLRVPPRLFDPSGDPLNIGEWPSLQFSNVLLSERFGARDRAYIAHIIHLFNKNILDEIHQLWPIEFGETSSHRFRGEGGGQDVNPSFLFAHYVMERLREVQLEAFWKNTVDADSDGELNVRERQWLIDRINEWNDGDQAATHQARDHLANHKIILHRFNMTLSGSTDYRVSGIDGYPYLISNADTSKSIHAEGVEQKPYTGYEPPAKRQCKINLQFCFGSRFGDPSIPVLSKSQTKDVFQHFFRDEFHCGDCLLEMAMNHRDLGIGALFPADESSPQYKQLVTDLERYQYVLGTSPYSFIALQSPEGAEKSLQGLWDSRDRLAYMCINDDYRDDAKTEQSIRHKLQAFLDKRYPFAAPWEKFPPIQITAPAE
ncbi:hypothetical protein DFQ27_006141 [Actinomortierella ambigua]|uniref:Uncharacterized protein n=1 Tax=Actinomortierella ambigua TaxID=1343610 RepID=A0A9P6UC82_9FUNG|nr:hypothetical protein DFQ27_006141 [Actinomortierella ambigua]